MRELILRAIIEKGTRKKLSYLYCMLHHNVTDSRTIKECTLHGKEFESCKECPWCYHVTIELRKCKPEK